MKISKLFHLLYAFLMFLPIFAIAVKCGYVMLNKNAKDSYSGSYTYDSIEPLSSSLYESYETTFTNTNISGSYYTYTGSNSVFYGHNIISLPYVTDTQLFSRGRIFYLFTNIVNLNINNVDSSANAILVGPLHINQSIGAKVVLFNLPSLNEVPLLKNQNESNQYIIYNDLRYNPTSTYYLRSNSFNISFDKLDSNIYSYAYALNVDTYVESFNPFITYFYVRQLVYDTTLSSVFYGALQELDNVEFFSWAKNSFLAEPFMYIGALFGIPNVHPIFTFLSYWMAISVIWLVFDVFMYVPLLAHKWIDKGKVD